MASEVLVGAGDIARCDMPNDEATAALLDSIPGTVFTAGDNAYPEGTPADYANCYDPSWGRHKARTRPAPGNHDYTTPGAPGYFGYFGAAAGDTSRGYYSYDLGAWHIVVMNNYKSVDFGSAQERWLRADLAAHPAQCTLGVWHEPLFSSKRTYSLQTQPLWQALYDAGAEVVITGHDHTYERFAPQTPTGTADPSTGIREFIVGTGGGDLQTFGTPAPNSEVRDATTHGVLKLTLHDGSYDWQFVPVAGQTFSDAGSAPCHGLPSNQPPQAAFTASCTGLSCNFTDGTTDPDGMVVAWRWTFGDHDSSTVQHPSHTYAAPGSYIVRLTATDDGGSTGSARQTITVTDSAPPPPPQNQPPVAGFTASCTDLTCSFTDGSTDSDGRVVAWSWSFGDGGTASTQNPSHTYAAAGTYTVQLTVTDDQGATGTTSKSVTVTAQNRAPLASFTASCTNLTCSFTDGSTDSDGRVVAWRWSFGDGGTASTQNPSHTYAAAGTYTVQLTVTDDQGATGTTSKSVTVTAQNRAPLASFTASCTNLTCSFTDGSTDSDGRVVAWRWSFGDGGTASTQNPSHTYAAAGTYTVQLTVTDDQGATGTTSKSITVTAPPPRNQPPVANPGGPYRSEGTVSFDGSGSSDPDNNTPLTYAWDFGDGTRGTGARPTHTYTADRTYTVTLTVTDAKGARSAPAQTTATIGNIPPTVNAGPDVSILPGFYNLRATFSDPGANDAPWTYTISWGDGSSETGRTFRQSDPITANHLYLIPGQYSVRVTVTDKDGGSGSDELIVTVGLSLSIP